RQSARERDIEGTARAFARTGRRRIGTTRYQRRDVGPAALADRRRTRHAARFTTRRVAIVMSPLIAVAPVLLARARADQVGTLYRQCNRTTFSMVLGGLILCVVLWGHVSPLLMAAWLAAILINQAWRSALARTYRRITPALNEARRWGLYWATGSTIAGALWGTAAVVMYPASPAYEA